MPTLLACLFCFIHSGGCASFISLRRRSATVGGGQENTASGVYACPSFCLCYFSVLDYFTHLPGLFHVLGWLYLLLWSCYHAAPQLLLAEHGIQRVASMLFFLSIAYHLFALPACLHACVPAVSGLFILMAAVTSLHFLPRSYTAVGGGYNNIASVQS